MNESKKNHSNVLFILVIPFIALLGYILFVCYQNAAAIRDTYNQAIVLMESGAYDQAIKTFKSLNGYKDSEQKIIETQKLKDESIELMLPSVTTQGSLNKWLNKMTSEEAELFKKYYTLYDPNAMDAPSDLKSLIGRYPSLEHEALYLLADSVPAQDLTKMESILVNAGYSAKDYWNDYSLDKQNL